MVIGISTDKLEDQKKFADKEKLNFPLLADADHKTTMAFGVLMASRPFAQRVTFVIDKQGIVRKVINKFDGADALKKHPKEVLEYIQANLASNK